MLPISAGNQSSKELRFFYRQIDALLIFAHYHVKFPVMLPNGTDHRDQINDFQKLADENARLKAEIEKLLEALVLSLHFMETHQLPLELLNTREVFLLFTDCIYKITGMIAHHKKAVTNAASKDKRRPGHGGKNGMNGLVQAGILEECHKDNHRDHYKIIRTPAPHEGKISDGQTKSLKKTIISKSRRAAFGRVLKQKRSFSIPG